LASLDRPSVEDGAADIPDPADQVGDACRNWLNRLPPEREAGRQKLVSRFR
jgi:hypothetical protein